MKLGIIGVGHLAGSIISGLLRTGSTPADITLSPRGHGPDLAQRHGCTLATDNAALVAACDTVLLAVRPADAIEAVKDLPWQSRHVLISACAGVGIDSLQASAPPARIVRIMPITAAELGASPTLVFPLLPAVEPLLDAIGSTIALDNEAAFDVATVSAAMYGWAQALIRAGTDWSIDRGLPEATARQLVTRTFVAAGRIQGELDAPMADILASLCTPGGITEAGLSHLDERLVMQAWTEACDLALHRMSGDVLTN